MTGARSSQATLALPFVELGDSAGYHARSDRDRRRLSRHQRQPGQRGARDGQRIHRRAKRRRQVVDQDQRLNPRHDDRRRRLRSAREADRHPDHFAGDRVIARCPLRHAARYQRRRRDEHQRRVRSGWRLDQFIASIQLRASSAAGCVIGSAPRRASAKSADSPSSAARRLSAACSFRHRSTKPRCPASVVTNLPTGTDSVYLFFNYADMTPETVYELRVTVNGVSESRLQPIAGTVERRT